MAVQIQMRRGTAAEWTAADPTLANGEWGLETDTGKFKIGTGSAAWEDNGFDYSSLPSTAITTTVIDAVGDIFIGTADNVAGRLAVGTNDYVLTADSSVSNVGLAWKATGTPTTITVADTTDTTCFVGLWESATGDIGPKSDAGITYNAGTGVLSATGFAGPITGAVTGNASTATNSTTVTVADTTNTTCSVALFESATGSLGAKTDAGATYNAATGVLAATGFAGPLTGLASSATTAAACTGNSATATTAGTVTTAAQGAITSVGTLSTLAVDGTSQLYECLTEAISGNKTPALTDAGKVFYCSQSGGTQTITIDGSISWPVGTQMVFVASNTSTVTFAESNSTSLDSKDDNKSIDGRYASAALINYGSNTWFLIGALA